MIHLSGKLGTLEADKRALEMRLQDKELELSESNEQLERTHAWLHESRERNTNLTAAVFRAKGMKVQKGFSMIPV